MDNPKALLLLVEDDAWTRYALARILGQNGWKVVSVPTVAEGLAMLEAKPACVLLDLQLPDGNGEAVLRAIRESGLQSRVIVVTAVTDERRIEGLRLLSPDAIVHKPIDVRELLEVCQT